MSTVTKDERTVSWESYYSDVRKFVVRQLGRQQDADDVVQDIYRELLYSRCDEATNPRAWLWRIAWRVIHHEFERRKRYPAQQSIDTVRTDRMCTADSIASLEAEEELLRVLEELPLATQIAIVRSRRDGCTYEQIAAELGVTPHMVKNHIGRAIAHFARQRHM